MYIYIYIYVYVYIYMYIYICIYIYVYIFIYVYIYSVSEIKGAPCTRRAHFHGRVHGFRRCAPGVCTFSLAIYYCYVLGGCMEQFPGAQFYGKCTLRVHKIKA